MERRKLRHRKSQEAYLTKEYKTLLARAAELRGKYVVVVDSQVFTAKTGKEASRLLAKVRKEFPGKTPLATFFPKEETLILWL